MDNLKPVGMENVYHGVDYSLVGVKRAFIFISVSSLEEPISRFLRVAFLKIISKCV